MQGPAPVSLEAAGDAGGWRLAVIALHLAAAAALLAWMPGLPTVALALVVLAVGAWTLRSAATMGGSTGVQRPAARPALAWDGQQWHHAGQPVRPRVALDLGGWLLLRLDAAGGAGRGALSAGWLPVSASVAGAAWPPLRAALVATGTRAASPDAAAGGTAA